MPVFIVNFTQDTRTLTLAALIFLDLAIAIIAAIRNGVFDFRKIGMFYRTMVVPYILGYLVVYVIGLFGVAELVGPIWGEVVAVVGAGVAIVNLLADIAANLGEMRGKSQPVVVAITPDPYAPVGRPIETNSVMDSKRTPIGE